MSLIVFVCVFGALTLLFYYVQKTSREKFYNAFGDDDDLEADPLADNQFEVRTKDPHHRVTMVSKGGTKHDPGRWEISAHAKAFGERTPNLVIGKEGLLDALRDKLGHEDIHTGDAVFDKAFLLRADEEDVVRGIFSSVAMRDAVRMLFRAGVQELEIRNGEVTAKAHRRGFYIDETKSIALATARFIELLEENAGAEPKRAPLGELAATSVEGSSVVVPVGERRAT